MQIRTRHQEGRVELRGGKVLKWYGHYYTYEMDGLGNEKRRHRGAFLGEKSKMKKFQAQEKLRRVIARETQHYTIPNRLNLEWYVRERFLPMREPLWAPSTRETNLYYIERQIFPVLGKTAVVDLDKFTCQMFLNQLAKRGFSFTVVDHCRTMLRAILEEAVDAELIGKNPARKIINPETPSADKPVLPKWAARVLLDSLPFRDRLITMIAAFCAMRPGEIFGLRWSSWRNDHFQIQGTVWRGILRPGKAKTKGSKAPVTIPNVLLPMLQIWRDQHPGVAGDGLIFPTEKGTPTRPENWLRRNMKPVAVSVGITMPVNFQVLRRTFATNAQGFGNPRDVQAHLRHTDIATTLGVYTQPIDANVRKLVNAVADDVMTSTIPARKCNASC